MAGPIGQLTAETLAARIDADAPITVLDTRPPDSFAAWHIPGAISVPYAPHDGLSAGRTWADVERTVSAAVETAIVCGSGVSSTALGLELDRRGHDEIAVVTGGMQAWSAVYHTVSLPTEGDDLTVIQLQRRAKGCLGYLIGDASAGRGIAVDVSQHTGVALRAAAAAGLRIEAVIDTHVHADHISGGPSLAAEVGVPYQLSADAADRGVTTAYTPLAAGDRLRVGAVTIDVLAAPGHTSEQIALLVAERMLVSADALFIDGVGRTELQFGDADADHGAALLYETLHERFGALDDAVWVLPGHVAVDPARGMVDATPDAPIMRQLGAVRETVPLLGADRDAFIAAVSADAPAKPPNHTEIIALNQGEDAVARTEAITLELGPNNCAAS